MRAKRLWVLVAVAALAALGYGGCDKDQVPTGSAPSTARASGAPTGSARKPAAHVAAPAGKPTPEALVKPKPGPLPASLPRYDGLGDLPADAYETQTTVGGKPAALRLKRDAVVHGVPCSQRGLVFFRNGATFSGCTLAVDFALEKIPLQRGTEVTFQTDGRFIGFVLPHPQLVLGHPVSARERVYLTADRQALAGYTLARERKFGDLTLKAGSKVSFAPNAPGHPLQSVRVKGQATLGGMTYPDGARLYLKPDGSLGMVRGVAKAPAPPLACPSESTVTVTSKRSYWPEGAAFGSVASAGVVKHNDHFPAAKNPDVALYLANYALPPGPPVLSKIDPPQGKAVLELHLWRTGGAGVVPGTYQVGPASDVDFRATVQMHMPGRSTLTMDAWHTTGSVEVTVVDGDKVCGRFHLDDGHLALQGKFAVTAGR